MRIEDIGTRGHLLTHLLSGSEFSENATIVLKRDGHVHDRIDVLSEAVAGQKVIHLGFCDHLPSIVARRNAGRWLHDHMRSKASRCLGLDINQEAVNFITDKLGIDDVACVDITDETSQSFVAGTKWDLLLIPELLEHIGNPVEFLRRIGELHGANIEAVIITVPNAFRAGSFFNALSNVETINSDHRLYFTPYTIMKIATDAGMKIKSLSFAQFTKTSGLSRVIKDMTLRRAPMLSENIILIASY